jgi:nicotinamidase-related amidase
LEDSQIRAKSGSILSALRGTLDEDFYIGDVTMPNDTAFLVIDVQKGMFGPEETVYAGDDVLAKISTLIAQARTAQVPVIYVQHNGTPGDPLEPGKEGWPIHPAIEPTNGEPVVGKRTPDSFHETSLQQELETRGIRKLIIAGMQTDYCIDATCRQAASLGYDVTLVKDAHTTCDSSTLTAPQIIAQYNDALGGRFVTPREASEITF